MSMRSKLASQFLHLEVKATLLRLAKQVRVEWQEVRMRAMSTLPLWESLRLLALTVSLWLTWLREKTLASLARRLLNSSQPKPLPPKSRIR